jgi:hypothetical protein
MDNLQSDVVNLHVFKTHESHSGTNWITQIDWVAQFIVMAIKPQLIVLET